MNQWLLITLLAVTTYLSRVIGVEIMAGRKLSPTLRLYFSYLPVGIITALIIKQILVPVNGQPAVSLPVLIGCLATAIAIKKIKVFLPAIIIGVIAGLLARYFLT